MREYLLVLFVAAAGTYIVCGLVRRFAARIGAFTPIRDRDVHKVPIPRLGGLSILIGISGSFVIATHLPFLGSIPGLSSDAWWLLLAGAVMATVGAIDDVVDLDAVTKLAGQLVAAGIIVLSGTSLNWLPLPNGETLSLSPSLGGAISTILIVGTANAVNFVDGLDGLAAGIVCIGSAAFCTYSYLLAVQNNHLNRATTPTLIAAAVTGGCLGFLPHNRFPARIFMGDAGALMLGTFLAASTISLTGWLDPSVLASDGGSLIPALLPLVLPFAVLALPFTDMVLAVVRRTRRGKSFLDPDDQHLHHRMLRIGHSHPRAVLIMYVWAGLVAFGAIALGLRPAWSTVGAVAAGAAVAVILTWLIPDQKGAPHPR